MDSRTIIEILNVPSSELLTRNWRWSCPNGTRRWAGYQLLSAVGTMTAKDRALKVNAYDPVAHYEDSAGRWIGFDN